MSHVDVEMTSFDGHGSVFNQLQLDVNRNILEECTRTTSRDRHFSVQSLTIMIDQRERSKTLLDLSEEKKSLRHFFSLTGNYWSKSGWHILARISFVLSKVAIFACAGLLATILYFYINTLSSVDDDYAIRYFQTYTALFLMLFLGTLSVLPAQYFNRLRMRMPAEIEDFMAVDECMRITYVFGLVSALCACAGLALESIENYTFIFQCTAVASVFVVLSLMFNMFFLVLDLKVSLLLLDQLHILADKKMLTMEKFNLVRTEIHRRVSASKLASDFVVIPSLASVVGIIISVTLLRQAQAYNDDDGSELTVYTGLILIQLKELFYIAVAFWYVAKVNGRADELTVKLSEGFWGEYKNPNNAISCDPNQQDDHELVEKVDLTDLHRVSLHMSGISRPISFTLLFKRLSWENVIVSAVGFGVTLLISFIRRFVTAN